MSTLQPTTHAPARATTRITAIVAAIGALIAIGVTVMILSLTGASTRNNAAGLIQSVPTGMSAPLSNGYGAGHAVLDPETGQMHGG